MGELKKIQAFCGPYIDIVCKGPYAMFCSESGQSFAQVVMPLIGVADEDSPGVRVDTELFMTLGIDSLMKLDVVDGEVVIEFYNAEDLVYKIKVPKQTCYNSITEKNIVLKKSLSCKVHDLDNVARLIRVISRFKSPFVSEGEFAYMYYNQSYVYKKAVLPQFCCDSDLLKKSISLTTKFCVCEDYLVFREGNVTIFIRKQKMPLTSDLEIIKRTKAHRMLEIDINKMGVLLSRLRAGKYTIELDLGLSKTIVISENGKFEVPVNISYDSDIKDLESQLNSLDDLSSEDLELDSFNESPSEVIRIPYWAVRVMERALKAKLFVYKRFYILKVNNIFITINKSA